jgi:hypothetical protein
MNEELNEPAVLPALPAVASDSPDQAKAPEAALTPPGLPPAIGRRGIMLLAVGVTIGLAVGMLLGMGGLYFYTLFTETLPSTRESVVVFNELNELRQQINALNEERNRKEKEQTEALSAIASKVRSTENGTLTTEPQPQKQTPRADKPPRKVGDPFADIDAEIENLQQTQKVLNNILDMFTTKPKDKAKGR